MAKIAIAATLAAMLAQRTELHKERDDILARDSLTADEESRAHEVANGIQEVETAIRTAQVRERFASNAVVQKTLEQGEEERAHKRYREHFLRFLRTGRVPETRHAFAPVYDEEGRELNTASSGGVLVPKLYEEQILKYLRAETTVRNLADLRTGIKGHAVLRYNTTVSAAKSNFWTTEAAKAQTAIEPAFAEVPLVPVGGLAKTEISSWLVQQSDFDIEAEVMDDVQRIMAASLEAAYVGGTGVNQPTGIFIENAGNGITAAVSAGTTRAQAITAGITVPNLLKMRYQDLPASNWRDACWVFAQDAFGILCSLPSGIAGDVRPIFTPTADSNPIGNGPAGTLLGWPVYVTEFVAAHAAGAGAKNVVATAGRVKDAFAIREWGSLGLVRDEVTTPGLVKFNGMVFVNSKQTRVKALTQLQVANAG